MRVLVIAGSKHGGTVGIARVIAEELTAKGHESVALEAGARMAHLARFDAFVIGSAMYVGHWTKASRRFLDENADLLRERPVWLFSSGPLGDPLASTGDPHGLAALMDLTGARDHRMFGGRLDRGGLSLAERTAAAIVRAPYGDFRDWDEVRAWACEIALELHLAGPVDPSAAEDPGSPSAAAGIGD